MTSEQRWDKRLRISTVGRDASAADCYRYPYEPTSYEVLRRLADSGHIRPEDVVVDYGCGKGRVSLFLRHQLGCRTIGVEYDSAICGQALENLAASGLSGVEFRCCRAERFDPDEGTCFYFFNPFSLEILRAVVGKLEESWYRLPRAMKLIFYYPSDSYRTFLMTCPALTFVEELDCRDLCAGEREVLLMFSLHPD